jgi:hypothetical protein
LDGDAAALVDEGQVLRRGQRGEEEPAHHPFIDCIVVADICGTKGQPTKNSLAACNTLVVRDGPGFLVKLRPVAAALPLHDLF